MKVYVVCSECDFIESVHISEQAAEEAVRSLMDLYPGDEFRISPQDLDMGRPEKEKPKLKGYGFVVYSLTQLS